MMIATQLDFLSSKSSITPALYLGVGRPTPILLFNALRQRVEAQKLIHRISGFADDLTYFILSVRMAAHNLC
ncbi:hypothetical protein [Nitrosococcus oceani]|uniref:hypothetical protein n=1 Tax=Nitrosococcus oceani TaxID=1229 RepID=UPI001FD23949|nr:hypothetical protein [Nitrosococcus oceani]